MIDVPRIRAICFDLDGTLSDTDDIFVKRLASWLNPVRWIFPAHDPLPFARRAVMATEGPGNFVLGIPDHFGLDDEIARFGDWIYKAGIKHSNHPFEIITGVRELLTCLHPAFPLAVVSARGEHSAMLFLQQFNLLDYFTCVATAQTCEHTKPYPDPIFWAAKYMGVSPDQCLMVGDTPVDIHAGKAAGTQTIGVLCGFGEKSELIRVGADEILQSTAQLANLLCK